jgi:signal transduction histidine kinase
VEQLAEAYAGRAASVSTSIAREVEDGLTVRTDPILLRRILDALLSNAVKFTSRGSITLTARAATTPPTGADGAEARGVCIEVRDTGCGMAPDYLPLAFEPFSQESSGLARVYESSGLGLALARRLTHRLDGTIALDSEAEIGTTARVWLPDASPDESDDVPLLAEAPRAV